VDAKKKLKAFGFELPVVTPAAEKA
jgi:hypothetical protein